MIRIKIKQDIGKYKDFELSDAQVDRVKHFNTHKSIVKYIRENGKAPEDTESLFTASDDDLERMKRVSYTNAACQVCEPNQMIVTYNAASTSDAVQLFNSGITSDNCRMYIEDDSTYGMPDGVYGSSQEGNWKMVDVSSGYTFSTAGEHRVKFEFTEKLNSTYYMFKGCTNVKKVEAEDFDTSENESFEGMFALCTNLSEIDMTNWNTSKQTSLRSMFYGCTNLTTITVGSGWDTSNTTTTDMFTECGTDSVTVKAA